MTGTYPLRVLDVLFCHDRAVAVEYAYATPLDLATGGHRRRADAFAATLDSEGLTAALDSARECREMPYERLDAVHVFDGGLFGRKKVRLETTDGDSLGLRVHAPLDVDAFTDALRSVLAAHSTTVERRDGLGLFASSPDPPVGGSSP